MDEEQQFCLRWNNFQANITSQFETLRDEEDFVDVTLACDGQRIKAHRVVLSACSPYFKELFRSNPCTHPILFMRDVEFQHLQSLVEFMYAGEVNVAQASLSSFLRTAESLQIRGLTEAPQRHKQDPKVPAESSPTATSSQAAGARPNSASPQASSQHNTSSQDEDDDDVLSLSPVSSPPPAKRAKEEEETAPPPPPPPPTVTQPVTTETTQQPETAYKEDSPEIFEPKMEAPDYSSDGESKGGGFFGLENSLDNPFSSMHGSMDMFAGPSAQGFTGDTSHEASQAYHQKLHSLDPRPCPICNRMYSNLSNLRQHVRLIHNPQTVACPLCSKPFKTKLYLKRHLMSFHELQCTNPVNKPNIVMPTQGSPDFFPPPQVFLGQLSSNSHATEDKINIHNSLPKMKDFNPEYFGTPYTNLTNNGERSYSSQMGNAQELAPFSTSQLSNKDDGENLQNSEKNGLKNRDNSFATPPSHENSDFRSAFVSQQLNLGQPTNNDGLAQFNNSTNEKTQSFLSTLSITKNMDVANCLDQEAHVNNQTSPKNNKET